ncbi:MAG: hypothetical protein E7508_12170 [Ruminococcus sp.]|nr:hypothetical protein [Ruminococcus sp.]
MTDMFTLADRLKALRERKDELADETKANNAEIEKTELELSQLMAQTETQSFQRAGTLFYLTSKTYASANKENKAELYEALKNEGYGSLITETVNANSLSAFVKEQMSENDDTLPDWLEGKVNVFDKVTVNLRKSK